MYPKPPPVPQPDASSEGASGDRINVCGVDVFWDTEDGICNFRGNPVALMRVGTTLASLMAAVETMVGPERFSLALQSEGRKGVEPDWRVISRYPSFQEGFGQLCRDARAAGWGDWQLVRFDADRRECVFRVKNGWEGGYQKALGVCWGSAMLAGKFSGICSRLFNTNCWATQTEFLARGDAYDEFVVVPSDLNLEREIEKLIVMDRATRAEMAAAMAKLKQTELTLRESEQRYDIIVRNVPVGVYVWYFHADGSMGFEFVSPRFCEILGTDAASVLKDYRVAFAAAHPEDRDRLIRDNDAARTALAPFRWEGRFVVNGETRWVRILSDPMIMPDGGSKWNGAIVDITERKRLEGEQERLARALKLVNACNRAIILAQDETELLADICELIVNAGGHLMAWVGHALDDEKKTIKLVARAGHDEGYLDNINFTWADVEHGRGPSGTAIRTGKTFTVQDWRMDPVIAPWREEALKRGYHSSMSLALTEAGRVWGALTLYSKEFNAFNPEEVKLMEELASSLSFGIYSLRTTAARKRDEELLRQNEAALRDTNRLLDSIIQNIPNTVFLKRASDLRYELLNRAGEELLGAGSQALVGCTDHEFFSRERADFMVSTDRKALSQPGIVDIPEVTIDTKYGPRILHSKKIALRNAEGVPEHLLGISEDITERRRWENALRLQSEITANAAEGIALIKAADSTIHYVNRRYETMFGYGAGELLGKHVSVINAPADKSPEAVAEEINRALVANGVWSGEVLSRRSDGSNLWTFANVSTFEHAELGTLWIVHQSDITEHRRLEAELQAGNEKLTSLYELSPVGIALTDMQGHYVEFNEAFSRICGYTRDELNHLDYWTLTPKEYAEKEAEQLESLNTRGYYGPYEKEYIRKDGTRIPLRLNGMLVLGSDGQPYIWSIVEDISDRKLYQAQLERIAHYDVLTGMPNRALLADRMRQAIAQTRREQNMMGLCYLDLDGFKDINDKLGHAAGDAVLIEVAQRIQKTIRGGDTVARLGGDEFVVIMLGMERGAECSVSLQRLLDVISMPIGIGDKSVSVGASIGVSLYPLDDEDPDTLLRHADQAMYQAKQSGKNRYHIYDPALDRRTRNHYDLLSTVRQALAGNEFVLHYQPKVDMGSGQLVGAEALIRWQHPQKGLLPPSEFMRTIENTELDVAVGDWVVDSALAQIVEWHAAGLETEVSINISAYHLESPGFVEKLRRKLALSGLPAKALQIEVLESAAIKDVAVVSAIIEECRRLGVGFALDDFGTGYSSLTYLSHLPVDALKIDQSFVRDMLEDRGDMAIVQGIIALARTFNRQTVAEGVETIAHYQVLLGMGCAVGQGYAIAKPMPPDALPGWRMPDFNQP